MAHPQIFRARIEGMDFTLYYDYDQLQHGLLSQLSDKGRIKWFKLRMEYIFLEPLRRLYSGKTTAYRELNSKDQNDKPARSFVIATFSVLLNGIEALGSFLTPPHPKTKRHSENKENFCAFLTAYMKPWDLRIPEFPGPKNYLPEILWKDFRNGIAHGFVIRGGGIDNEADQTKYLVVNGRLEIGPNAFFKDFLAGVNSFFSDVRTIRRDNFLHRFRCHYPH